MPPNQPRTAPKLRLPRTAPTDGRSWAKRLQARHEAGEHLHECQISAYTQVLGIARLSASEKEAREERLGMMEY